MGAGSYYYVRRMGGGPTQPGAVDGRVRADGETIASDPPGAELNTAEGEASDVLAPAAPGLGPAEDSGDEDRALVARVQKGDDEAFRLLVVRYQRRAYAVAFGIVKNRQDALDVLQEAFIKVHRYIGSFQGSSSFYTWLYRIVVNLAIDHVRKEPKGRGLEFDEKVGRTDDEVAGDGSMLPRILGSNPAKAVARKELVEVLERALAGLAPYHRAVILLREVEGLSYEEMARALKVPKGTIMSRLFHARRRLQAALADYLDGDLEIG